MSDNTNETVYSATFTLTQTGPEGDVRASLKLDPTPDPEVPVIVHGIMATIANDFLNQMGVTDDEGNLTEEYSSGDSTKH